MPLGVLMCISIYLYMYGYREIFHIFFIHPSVRKHLPYFPVLTAVTNAVVSFNVQILTSGS